MQSPIRIALSRHYRLNHSIEKFVLLIAAKLQQNCSRILIFLNLLEGSNFVGINRKFKISEIRINILNLGLKGSFGKLTYFDTI